MKVQSISHDVPVPLCIYERADTIVSASLWSLVMTVSPQSDIYEAVKWGRRGRGLGGKKRGGGI